MDERDYKAMNEELNPPLQQTAVMWRFIAFKDLAEIKETLETIILGHIAKELKDEIQIGRQVNLAKTITQALRIHDVSGSVCGGCKKPLHDGLCGDCCTSLASGNY